MNRIIKRHSRGEKGFTLVEIIAVLVILGILAAVAIPKYLSMADEARIKAAQGAVAEIKGRCATVQAKMMMRDNGTAPTAAQVLANATAAFGYGNAANFANVGADFTVTAPTVSNAGNINITVTAVQGQAVTPAVTSFWASTSGL